MRVDKDVQLICLPFAGCGAAFFSDWNALSRRIETLAVELPGSGTRFAEPPYETVSTAIDGILPQLLERVDPSRPIATFGHSLGAILAYELARSLTAFDGLFVIGVIPSGSPDPWSPPRGHHITRARNEPCRQQMKRLSSYSPVEVESTGMGQLPLPVSRADARMYASYRPDSAAPLDIPIVAMRGQQDQLVSRAQLAGWRKATTAAVQCAELPGDHMYLAERPGRVLQTIESALI